MDSSVPARTSTPARRWARLALFLGPAVVVIAMLGAVTVDRVDVPAQGDQAPSFEAPLLEVPGSSAAGSHSMLALDDLRGRPVVLNFWASWCEPCKEEAPLLRRAHAAYGDDVAFVGVNIKDARSDAAAFATEHGLVYPHVRDERGTIYDGYGLTGQPETFFIDGDGDIVEHVNGPLSEQSLVQLLDLLVTRNA